MHQPDSIEGIREFCDLEGQAHDSISLHAAAQRIEAATGGALMWEECEWYARLALGEGVCSCGLEANGSPAARAAGLHLPDCPRAA